MNITAEQEQHSYTKVFLHKKYHNIYRSLDLGKVSTCSVTVLVVYFFVCNTIICNKHKCYTMVRVSEERVSSSLSPLPRM